jgi:arginyl-tRNA synthetase
LQPLIIDIFKQPKNGNKVTFPRTIRAALNYEPHVLAYYLRDLAGDFHSYYNNSEFLIDDKTLQASRLQLIIATKQVLQNGLGLLGVSAPEKM